MRRITLLAACLLAAAPALAQQRTTAAPNPLANTSSSTAPAAPAGRTAPATPGAPLAPTAAPLASSTASDTGANQFTTEAAAQAHCPGDAVVWENPRSKAYHVKGDRYFGHTKVGAYMCKRDADAAGMHAGGTTAGSGRKKTASASARH